MSSQHDYYKESEFNGKWIPMSKKEIIELCDEKSNLINELKDKLEKSMEVWKFYWSGGLLGEDHTAELRPKSWQKELAEAQGEDYSDSDEEEEEEESDEEEEEELKYQFTSEDSKQMIEMLKKERDYQHTRFLKEQIERSEMKEQFNNLIDLIKTADTDEKIKLLQNHLEKID